MFKFPLKLLLTAMHLGLMFICVGMTSITIHGLIFFVSIFTGIFGRSCELLEECDGLGKVLGCVFFPLMVCAGIVQSIREIYCETASNLCR